MSYRLKYFDPLKGLLSPRLTLPFIDPLFKARRLLAHRSLEDLHAIADILDQISRQGSFQAGQYAHLAEEAMPIVLPNGEIGVAWPAPNQVDLFHRSMEHISLSGFAAPENAAWYELFAVLALCFIDETCGFEQRIISGEGPDWAPPTIEQCDYMADSNAGLAKQAISIAERLLSESSARRRQARQGGKERQAPAQALKRAVIALYVERYAGRSNREAASRILTSLVTEDRIRIEAPGNCLYFDGVLALNTDDPAMRFQKWIGEHRRANLA